VGNHRDFTFDVWAEHSKSKPTDVKPFMKWAWSHHVTRFKFLAQSQSKEWLNIELSNFVHK